MHAASMTGARSPCSRRAPGPRRLMKAGAEAPPPRRDRALFELLYSSGLRLAELVSINVTDVDLRDATVTVTGKGAKTRIVPVGAQARAALAGWRKGRAPPPPLRAPP